MAVVTPLAQRESADILQRIVERDAAAFSEVVRTFDRDLIGLAYVLAHADRETASDAVQRTWEKLWATPPTLRNRSSLRSWLLSVVANEVRQVNRRRLIGSRREPESAPPSQVMEDLAGWTDLKIALSSLPPTEVELIALRHVVGLSADEIAIQQGLTAGAVRSRLKRAMDRLRARLEVHEP